MNRIVITGDTHGSLDTSKIETFQNSDKKLDYTDYLIICGDCGVVWSADSLNESITYYENFGTNILFIDGNHENFELLQTFPTMDWHGGVVHKISEHIYHLVRGYVFDICGKTFLAIGGADSTDKEDRIPHVSWWSQETFSYYDVYTALENLKKFNNKVDYVLSHSPNDECLDKVKEMLTMCDEEIPQYLKKVLSYSNTSTNLQSVANEMEYKRWFCGHIHMDERLDKYTIVYNRMIEI